MVSFVDCNLISPTGSVPVGGGPYQLAVEVEADAEQGDNVPVGIDILMNGEIYATTEISTIDDFVFPFTVEADLFYGAIGVTTGENQVSVQTSYGSNNTDSMDCGTFTLSEDITELVESVDYSVQSTINFVQPTLTVENTGELSGFVNYTISIDGQLYESGEVIVESLSQADIQANIEFTKEPGESIDHDICISVVSVDAIA